METIEEFQRRAEESLRAHDARITAPLLRRLAKAERCVRSLAAELTKERTRIGALLSAAEETCAESETRCLSARYIGVVGLVRAQKANGL